jgi:hypothetical protein
VTKLLRRLGAVLNPLLLAGDLLAYFVATIIGFQRCGEFIGSAWQRMLISFCVAWLIVAPWLGIYQLPIATRPGQLWRPPLAAGLAAPLAGWLRGLWLGHPVLVIFVTVMAVVTAGLIFLWRLFLVAVISRPAGARGSGGISHG